MTLTGACALVVRGGDGGRDSTGSDGGVALLAIPRSPLPRARRDPDESACNRYCWRRQQQPQPLPRLPGTATGSPDIADVVVDGDAVAAAGIAASCCFSADSKQSLVDPWAMPAATCSHRSWCSFPPVTLTGRQ